MTKRFAIATASPWDCPDCGEPIRNGDEVALVGDLADRHICCDACAELHDDQDEDEC